MRRLRILLADDHTQVLDLVRMLSRADYDIVAAVHNEQDLVTAARLLKPDIVVVDIDVPKLNRIETIRELHKTAPDCCVILKSCLGKPMRIAAAYSAGASIYLVKGVPPTLLSAIRSVSDHAEKARERDTVLLSRSS